MVELASILFETEKDRTTVFLRIANAIGIVSRFVPIVLYRFFDVIAEMADNYPGNRRVLHLLRDVETCRIADSDYLFIPLTPKR